MYVESNSSFPCLTDSSCCSCVAIWPQDLATPPIWLATSIPGVYVHPGPRHRGITNTSLVSGVYRDVTPIWILLVFLYRRSQPLSSKCFDFEDWLPASGIIRTDLLPEFHWGEEGKKSPFLTCCQSSDWHSYYSLSWALHVKLWHITANAQGIALFKEKKGWKKWYLPSLTRVCLFSASKFHKLVLWVTGYPRVVTHVLAIRGIEMFWEENLQNN